MNVKEFSNEFDILYNNIMSNQAPGLNEYEKSVFLTKAQDELVKNYFTPTEGGNKYQQGFDDSRKRHMDFSALIVNTEKELGIADSLYGTAPEASIVLTLEGAKILFILSEVLALKSPGTDTAGRPTTKTDKTYQVIPIKLNELQSLLNKPYGRPLKRQAWRVWNDGSDTDSLRLRFILHDSDTEYFTSAGHSIVYQSTIVKQPSPIILSDIGSDYNVSINGERTPMTCMLNEEIHPEIVQRAVELAKIAYTGEFTNMVEAGKRSE